MEGMRSVCKYSYGFDPQSPLAFLQQVSEAHRDLTGMGICGTPGESHWAESCVVPMEMESWKLMLRDFSGRGTKFSGKREKLVKCVRFLG